MEEGRDILFFLGICRHILQSASRCVAHCFQNEICSLLTFFVKNCSNSVKLANRTLS